MVARRAITDGGKPPIARGSNRFPKLALALRAGDWPVRLTASGETAVRIWPGLVPEVDARWSKRFGDDATRLRRSLEAIER
jgi:hypothetical protein